MDDDSTRFLFVYRCLNCRKFSVREYVDNSKCPYCRGQVKHLQTVEPVRTLELALNQPSLWPWE